MSFALNVEMHLKTVSDRYRRRTASESFAHASSLIHGRDDLGSGVVSNSLSFLSLAPPVEDYRIMIDVHKVVHVAKCCLVQYKTNWCDLVR